MVLAVGRFIPRTLEEYHLHFKWFLDYLEQDLSREEKILEVFLERIGFMINEKGLQPTTANIRISFIGVKARPFMHQYSISALDQVALQSVGVLNETAFVTVREHFEWKH
ncbi:hypothetical protein SAMN05444673_2188 [Bacillus sp. OV166]|uniref:hypothetical protein n=1 Tax=Bacillus sp. OV166 TaxID=1882763 RepID=UPI000A2AECA8|nr:hypothetical protein [Bacillus sp. OV166]SMQ72382.1 hypothetical protein SAMN05444673_2188 [Bacillus sp. OV166]